jgi:hypothetical protein
MDVWLTRGSTVGAVRVAAGFVAAVRLGLKDRLAAGAGFLTGVGSVVQGFFGSLEQGWIVWACWATTAPVTSAGTPNMNSVTSQAQAGLNFANLSVLFEFEFGFDIDLMGRACIVCRTTGSDAKAYKS